MDRRKVLFWDRMGKAPRPIQPEKPRQDRKRHTRKYAEGALGEDKSFYFRGPEAKLNLRAQNLTMFLQIGEGVDDATWLHHLRAGDYSRWMREVKIAPIARFSLSVVFNPNSGNTSIG